MIDPQTPIACLTVGQFLELQRQERERPTPPKKELPKYLSPADLATLCKWKLSTVYQNKSHGLIPGAKKIGNKLLFDTEVILDWIDENSLSQNSRNGGQR